MSETWTKKFMKSHPVHHFSNRPKESTDGVI